MFVRWGRTVYRARWLVLAAVLPFLILAVAAVAFGKAPNYNGQPPVAAGRASALIDHELPTFGTSFELIFRSATLKATDPAFRYFCSPASRSSTAAPATPLPRSRLACSTPGG